MEGFMTPPQHKNFNAKKLCSGIGETIDCAIAYLGNEGGGPFEKHTHPHNHFFIVTEGEAKILLGDKEIILKKDEAFLVDGSIPHSVWNISSGQTVMLGISLKPVK